jgi:hypothetical protein
MCTVSKPRLLLRLKAGSLPLALVLVLDLSADLWTQGWRDGSAGSCRAFKKICNLPLRRDLS